MLIQNSYLGAFVILAVIAIVSATVIILRICWLFIKKSIKIEIKFKQPKPAPHTEAGKDVYYIVKEKRERKKPVYSDARRIDFVDRE